MPIDVKELRKRANASQQEFAHKIGVPVGTLRNWEYNRCQPSGPALALLRLIESVLPERAEA